MTYSIYSRVLHPLSQLLLLALLAVLLSVPLLVALVLEIVWRRWLKPLPVTPQLHRR